MKDANGNTLYNNALVHVKVGTEWLQGRITELKEGGSVISMIRATKELKETPVITAASVKITCEVASQADPRNPLFGDIVILMDPVEVKAAN